MTSLSACRRDLWVYTDEFRQVELITDWSEATELPGGMTWWFMNDDHSGRNFHETTAEVSHSWLGLPKGVYSGVVFDYSPAEYSHQSILGMTYIDSAIVHVNPSADQPLPNERLYGSLAVPASMTGITREAATGMYTLAAEPETMNADTLHHVNIITGNTGELILWEDRDQYEATLITQTIYAYPHPLVWKLKVSVAVRGIAYMAEVRGSVAGLTDGCWLGKLRHTNTPCLQALDEWRSSRTVEDSVGVITTTINTFGLRDMGMSRSPFDSNTRSVADVSAATPVTSPSATRSVDIYDRRLRLNLQFLLRDRSTVMDYQYDVSGDDIKVYEDQLLLVIDIPVGYPGGIPDLPYADPADGTGFDATVTPWADGGTADATM